MAVGVVDVESLCIADDDDVDAWPLDDVDCAFATAFDDAWALLVEPDVVEDAWLADCEVAPEEEAAVAAAGVLVSELVWLSVAILFIGIGSGVLILLF